MKLYEFLRLSEVEHYNVVWSLGVHVDTHITNNVAINLHPINDFYYELYYDLRTNKTLNKQKFIKGRLDKYLNMIKM
jgi:hypothetical protein